MNLTYEPNFGDNFHGVLYGFWGTRAGAVKPALMCLTFAAIAALVLWNMGLPWHWIAVIAVFLSLFWGAFFTLAFGALIAASLTKRQRAIGPARIVVTDEGIERINGSASVKQSWGGITRIEETKRVFFMYGASSPVFAIEKSAVGSKQELLELRRLLRGKKPGAYRDDADA